MLFVSIISVFDECCHSQGGQNSESREGWVGIHLPFRSAGRITGIANSAFVIYLCVRDVPVN